MKLSKQKLKEIIEEEVKKADLARLKSQLKQDVEDAVEKVEHQ